jgi:ferric-dicitrate binding protein FerR (iron transport regulator)
MLHGLGRTIVPGSYERRAPLHREAVTAVAEPAATFPPLPAPATVPLAAAPRPPTRLAQGAAILGNVAFAIGVVYLIVLVPIVLVHGIAAVGGLLFR